MVISTLIIIDDLPMKNADFINDPFFDLWNLSQAAVRHQRLPLQHRPQRLWPPPRLAGGRAAGGGHGAAGGADGHRGLQQRHQRLRAGEALGGGLAVLGDA